MTFVDPDAMYALLPSFVRQKDLTQGAGVLNALVKVLAEQAKIVNDALDQQYDDQFIETCKLWVVPYLGELIGFTPVRPLGPGEPSPNCAEVAEQSGPLGPGVPSATRAEVADTIGYRRRKGTVSMLEQLNSDVTEFSGTEWIGMAVEYFSRVSTTQYVRNHVRLGNVNVNVRSPMTAVDVNTAFDTVPRTIDVRRIESGRGRYNIPNVGVFVWRLQPYTVRGNSACPVETNQYTNRYTFDPFGGDVPLVNRPATAPGEFALLSRQNVPFFLQYYPMYAEVEDYTSLNPVSVSLNGATYDSAQIEWCNLSSWTAPTTPGIEVAVDPELGRLVFATPVASDAVTVGYTYAFSGNYGGGVYDYPPSGPPTVTIQTFASADTDLPPVTSGVVQILDSAICGGDLILSPEAGSQLVVTAADQERPVLSGSLSITAAAGAEVTLIGLGIGGSLTVMGEDSFKLSLQHCTVRGAIDWSADDVGGALSLDHTLCGAIAANSAMNVTISDSAVDAGSDEAPAVSDGAGAAAGSVTVCTSTIIGTVNARTIPELSNSIVTGPVVSTELQAGCLRYSFVPLTVSRTPRRFRCQPDLEINTELAAALALNPSLSSAEQAAIQTSIETWLSPVFSSRTPGQPAYLQLADATPDQILSGASEGDEMGVFYRLFSRRRESNLSYRLNEYLRMSLEAGVIHAT